MKSTYDEWLLSGRQIFLAEGVDYHDLTEKRIMKTRLAAGRRGLRLAVDIVRDPPGFVFKAYLPSKPRPKLGRPTQTVTKKNYPALFCREIGCDNRLRPIDNDERCLNHK